MCKTGEQMKFPCIWVWHATRLSSKLKSVLILILHLQGKWVFRAMRYNNGNASLFPKPFLFFCSSSFFFPLFLLFNFALSLLSFLFHFSFLAKKKKKEKKRSCRALLSSFYHYNRDTQAKKKVMLTNYGFICWLCNNHRQTISNSNI